MARACSPLPAALSAALLGLCLAACTGGKSGKADAGKADAGKTTADAPANTTNSGADDGSSAGEEPRPTEKYGAPPLPDDEVTPIADHPPVKYGAPPLPDEGPKPEPEPEPAPEPSEP